MEDIVEGEDYYREGSLLVFTRRYHLKRGYCCGSGCRHCPYDPRWTRGATELAHDAHSMDTESETGEK